jgi:hypothetical protein
LDDLTIEALAQATGTDADEWALEDGAWTCAGEHIIGVPSWRVDAYGITATVGVLKVKFDDRPQDVPDVCRRIRAALSAFMAVSA